MPAARGSWWIAATLAIACGRVTNDDTQPYAGPTNGYAAAHPAFPQLVDQGGPILTAPRVVTVTFPGDSNAAQLAAFGAQVTNNAWWDAVRQGYCETGTTRCVGDGPAGESVELTGAPDPSYTDSSQGGPSTLQAYIRSLVESGRIPRPDAQTILVFYLPATTSVTLDGGASCDAFAAYHNSMSAGGVQFMYVVVTACASDPGYVGPSLTEIQQSTFAASHEIVEAATDPFVTGTSTGFYLDTRDPAGLPWNNLAGGETADLCEDILGLGQDQATEDGFTVTRVWNNAAARAGGDPCVPASTAVYINAAPETWLVKIEVGASATLVADAFSSAPAADWLVFGGDLNATESDRNPYLTITVNGARTATVNNGDRVTVRVTLNQDPANLPDYSQSFGATGLLISSDNRAHPTVAHFWPFLVVTPSGAAASGLGNVDPTQKARVSSRAARSP
jgi:hypothetical protein